MECPSVKEVWRGSEVGCLDGQFKDFVGWQSHVLNNFSLEVSSYSAMLLWMIWFSRNDLVWNQNGILKTQYCKVMKDTRVKERGIKL